MDLNRLMSPIFLSLSLCLLAVEPVLASSGGDGSLLSKEMLYKGINLLIFLGLLHFFTKKPLTRMLRSVAVTTREDFDRTSEKIDRIQKELDGLQQDEVRLIQELKTQRAVAIQATVAQKQKLIDEAHEQVKGIQRQAQFQIEQEIAKAKGEIRAFLAEHAIALATEASLKQKGQKESERFNAYLGKL